MQGNITRVCHRRGYFFVDGGKEKPVFAHYTQLRDAEFADIFVGDKCEFTLGNSEKGPVALDVFVEPVDESERIEGEIDSLNGSYGFIQVAGDRVFFHVTACNFFVT